MEQFSAIVNMKRCHYTNANNFVVMLSCTACDTKNRKIMVVESNVQKMNKTLRVGYSYLFNVQIKATGAALVLSAHPIDDSDDVYHMFRTMFDDTNNKLFN